MFCWHVFTFNRSKKWVNDEVIWNDNLAKYGDDVFPLNNLALYYAKVKNQPEKALEYLNRSLAYAPGNSAALVTRGNVYGALGKIDESIADFTEALPKIKRPLEANIGLAIGYARKGQMEKAQSFFEKARDYEPENPSVLANLGEFYNNVGKYQQAVDVLMKIEQLNANTDRTHYFLALSHFNLNNFDMALKQIDKALRLQSSRDYSLLKSKIHFNAGDKQAAKQIAQSLLNQGFPIEQSYRDLLGI